MHLQAFRRAEIALRRGRYDRAERELRRALGRAAGAGCADDLAAARAWNLLGIVAKHQGRFAPAARAYAAAASILRQRLPVDHIAFGALDHNLAGLDFSRGRFPSAERKARRGLTIRRRCVGAQHVDYARDLGALGAILSARKKHGSALRLLRRARRIFEARRGFRGRPHELAVTDHNIAATLHALGRFSEAERHYLSAIRLKAGCLVPRHPSLSLSLDSLARMRRARGRRAAEPNAVDRAVSPRTRALAWIPTNRDNSRHRRRDGFRGDDVPAKPRTEQAFSARGGAGTPTRSGWRRSPPRLRAR